MLKKTFYFFTLVLEHRCSEIQFCRSSSSGADSNRLVSTIATGEATHAADTVCPESENHGPDWEKSFTVGLLPSRKLTYPPKMAYLKMIFLFPRWDMLISWRVSSLVMDNSHL